MVAIYGPWQTIPLIHSAPSGIRFTLEPAMVRLVLAATSMEHAAPV